MDRETYAQLEKRFAVIFAPAATRLKPDSLAHVEHYLDCGELEMAYESFVLSLIEETIELPGELKTELRLLGKELGLDKESVFRGDFWEAATKFLAS